MPNPIKYTTGSESDALKKGNMYIGTGAVGKGPSNVTGYYQGPNVPSGGYVIYMNKVGAPGGLSYHSAANDAELISFTNSLAGQSYTTAQQCFDYYYGQTDKVLVNQDYPADFPYIVMDGLIVYLDAGISQSYGGSGTVWNDINGLGPKNNGTLTNGPTFSTDSGGGIVFDGSNDYVGFNSFDFGNELTVFCFIKPSVTYNIQSIFANSVGGFTQNGIRLFINSYLNNSKKICIEVGNGVNGYSIVTDNDVVTYNSWQQIAFTLSKTTGNGVIYYNGVSIKSETLTVTNYNSNGIFRLGIFTSGQYAYNGTISNYIIYNRALSASEILQNYNATKGRFGL